MNRRDWMIAVPVLAALTGCLAAFLHGMQIQSSVDGMAALRSLETPAGARVAVVAARALHLLDADGRRLARQDLGAIGLQGNPNDMDLTLDAAGQLEAWFFDDARPLPCVIRCTWNEASAAFRPCLVVASGAQLKWDVTSRAVHLAVDRAGERMFIADARSARVQRSDRIQEPQGTGHRQGSTQRPRAAPAGRRAEPGGNRTPALEVLQ